MLLDKILNIFKNDDMKETTKTIEEMNQMIERMFSDIQMSKNHSSINNKAAIMADALHSDTSFLRDITTCVNMYLSGAYDDMSNDVIIGNCLFMFNSTFNKMNMESVIDMNYDNSSEILSQYIILNKYKKFVDFNNKNTSSGFYKAFDSYFNRVEKEIFKNYPWIIDFEPDTPKLDSVLVEAENLFKKLEDEMIEYSNIVIGRILDRMNILSKENKEESCHLKYTYQTAILKVYESGFAFDYSIYATPVDDNTGIIPYRVDGTVGSKSFIYLDSEKFIFDLAMFKLIFLNLI